MIVFLFDEEEDVFVGGLMRVGIAIIAQRAPKFETFTHIYFLPELSRDAKSFMAPPTAARISS